MSIGMFTCFVVMYEDVRNAGVDIYADIIIGDLCGIYDQLIAMEMGFV